MERLRNIFEDIGKLTQKDGQSEFIAAIIADLLHKEGQFNTTCNKTSTYQLLKTYLLKIIHAIDALSDEISKDDSILISVKDQKLIRTCFQLISSLGISTCLISGLGISLHKRCSNSTILPQLQFTDEEKYELLVECTNFFIRSYKVSVLKKNIITLHLSDYLAALIQLAFAPLKKPGVYENFLMSDELYNHLQKDRRQFLAVYEDLVENSFQPTLMKELLVLQGMNNPPSPTFVKRVIAKEMSRRLIANGGLHSLIRCFIESYNIDIGFDWKKIDMITKIISIKHGNVPEKDYLSNICLQLEKILMMNNSHYLVTAIACVLSLNDKYSDCDFVKKLMKNIFEAFNIVSLKSKSSGPGTIILSPNEVDHSVNLLHACVCSTKLEYPMELLSPNIEMLFLIGSKCTKNEDLAIKLKDILIKCFEKLSKSEILDLMKTLFFDNDNTMLTIEENDVGIAVKTPATKLKEDNPKSDELLYFLKLFTAATEIEFVKNVFVSSLDILIELSKRRKDANKDLLTLEEEPVLLDNIDTQYANILQLLSEISMSPKIVTALKENPLIVLNFIEYFLSEENYESNMECTSIAIVLLNTLLSKTNTDNLENRFIALVPALKKMAEDETDFNHILCKEALSFILNGAEQKESECNKAISDVFDNLLPVRAHGLIELTKLIDAKEPETISKRHYIFCLFQEQLKDADSYIYLAAINGLASLCTHCTEDVLHVLCNEFLQMSTEHKDIQTHKENKVAELRMKIGDIIVKVTRRLGEMAVVHKTPLLNTMLCGCRDDDPLIRTSALSNLAEIALVLHYKMGNIIYEVLLCIWSIIETDKAVECRRAAVMVISSLLKGLGKDTLIQLKEHLLPLYRTLKQLYNDNNEDSVLRLHAQIALEELNDIVREFLFPELKMEKDISIFGIGPT